MPNARPSLTKTAASRESINHYPLYNFRVRELYRGTFVDRDVSIHSSHIVLKML